MKVSRRQINASFRKLLKNTGADFPFPFNDEQVDYIQKKALTKTLEMLNADMADNKKTETTLDEIIGWLIFYYHDVIGEELKMYCHGTLLVEIGGIENEINENEDEI